MATASSASSIASVLCPASSRWYRRLGRSSAGRLPSSTSRNANCGRCRPITSRHTVSGVDSTSPTGPHSAVQNVAATISDMADRPVLAPYSQGSTRLLLMSSSTTMRASTQATIVHPGSTAKASSSGNTAPTSGPT